MRVELKLNTSVMFWYPSNSYVNANIFSPLSRDLPNKQVNIFIS